MNKMPAATWFSARAREVVAGPVAFWTLSLLIVLACGGCTASPGVFSATGNPVSVTGSPMVAAAVAVPAGTSAEIRPAGSAPPSQQVTVVPAKPARLGQPRAIDLASWQERSKAGDAKALAEDEKGPPLTGSLPVGMTFDQAINTALLADPRIRAGLEGITQAKADLLTSSLFPNPTFFSDGVFLPLRNFTPDKPGGPPQMDVQIGYPIDWFLFGKRAAAMSSSTLGVRQSEADYADLIRLRVKDTALAFFDVLEAKALLDLARQDTENLSKLEAATKKAVDAGGRPLVELNRVRLDRLRSEQALRETESALAIARAKLRAFFGRTDPAPAFDAAGNLDAPLVGEPPPVEEAFALAQQNRPDIQSLRWQVSKAQADTVVEHRKAFPQITPQIGPSWQFQTHALGVPDADSMTVSVTATVPLFDRNQGNRWKAQSIVVQNNFNLQAGLADMRAEIVQAVQDFHTAHQNATAVAQEQLKLAAEVRDSITQAYELGGRPLIDVLDAERNYRDTYRLYINSRANYWRAVYTFSAAVGKQVGSHDESSQH